MFYRATLEKSTVRVSREQTATFSLVALNLTAQQGHEGHPSQYYYIGAVTIRFGLNHYLYFILYSKSQVTEQVVLALKKIIGDCNV